jgi:hypothetical protein
MRTIAGQIQKYNFSSAKAGVNDPTCGSNVEAISEKSLPPRLTGFFHRLLRRKSPG